MKYLVEGADKTTGDDRRIIITAEGVVDAQNKASAMGILVSRVQARESEPDEPVPEPSRDDLLDELEELEVTGVITAKAAQGAAIAPVPPSVPDYYGLQFASGVLGTLGALSFVAAVVVLIQAISSGDAAGIIFFASLFVAGGIQIGLSAACVALRDIARNSFRL